MKKKKSKDEEKIPIIKHMVLQYPQPTYSSSQESKENENKLNEQKKAKSRWAY